MEIRELTQDDTSYFPKGIEIIRKSDGWPGVIDNHLELFVNANECCCFGAFENNELIGVATGGILPSNQFDFYKVFSGELSNLMQPGLFGVMLVNAVESDWRGKGIGTKLLQKRVDWLNERGVKYILSNSWNSKRKGSSPSLFRKMGFEEISHYCSIFDDCPICDGECRCENFVFLKKF